MADAPAFIANGYPITFAQRAACFAVMQRPTFTTHDTERALLDAGVPDTDYTAGRAADRLRQAERKAGRIRPAKGRGNWERVDG